MRPGVVGREWECERWRDAEPALLVVWIGELGTVFAKPEPEPPGPPPNAASSALAERLGVGGALVELMASS